MKGSLKNLPHTRNTPSGITGKGSTASPATSEDIKKLQQDMNLLSARLSQGNPASSSVVGDLRSTVADARGPAPATVASKTELLDNILKKIAELDRSILKKTEPVNAEHARPRRNSNTMDLHCIPTHFQIIDRLVDLHTQSKRPVIVHQHSSATPEASAKAVPAPPAASNNGEITALKAKHEAAVAAMMEKLRGSEGKFGASEKKNQETAKEILALKAENAKVKAENEKLKVKVAELQSREPALAVDTHAQELAIMTDKYTEAMKNCRSMEEKIECAASSEQHICNAMLKLANNIQDDKSLGNLESYFPDLRQKILYTESFGRVVTAATDRIDAFKLDITACTTHAQLLENELSSLRLEKQLITDDYNSMTVSFNSLRVAFSEMESESIQLRVRLESKEKSSKENDNKVTEEALLAFRTTANAEIERLQKLLTDMETMMNERNREVSRYNSHISMLEQQLEEYKVLTDKLKKKIRDITPLDKRELLDSFEEVMRDEMMTMKGAFESKLKLAKGEMEVLSKKHQQDILRLKESVVVKKPAF